MNFWHESNCPVCRHPYNHFPNVCRLLHFLLLKMYPIAYKRREKQVGEEEKQMGHFSPQFDHHVFGSHSNQDVDVPNKSVLSPTDVMAQDYSDDCFSRQTKSSSLPNSLEATKHINDTIDATPSTLYRSSEGSGSTATEKCSLTGEELEDRTLKQCSVSVSDLQCAECKNLLFRPLVLNCGHVYCETCICTPMAETPRCGICQSLHPNGFPGICLLLEQFLEKHFPKIYAKRREGLLKQTDCLAAKRQEGSTQVQHQAKRSSMFPSSIFSSWLFGNGPKVHYAVGCDSCGMSPIIGERYKCKDCMEKMGFDLCEACYNKPWAISGRFNQQHKPEHTFENVPPGLPQLGLRLSSENEDGFNDPEDEEDFVAPMLLHDAVHGSNDVDVVSPALVQEQEDGSNDVEVVCPAADQEDDANNSSGLTGAF
ncbi:conserved hypothetical protein [Ricinus communis]|uniref:Zinc finger protein n=2 Tax=Ricinus communis TaxID=3988 RepID=B9RWJ2_RICCO|nr:conserved hypothetical protein [Ricinus communis]